MTYRQTKHPTAILKFVFTVDGEFLIAIVRAELRRATMPDAEYDIFISYSSKDEKTARRLYDRLKDRGYGVWLDRKNIVAGDDFVRKVFGGIRDSRYFAVLLTQNSVESGWVAEELSAARVRELEQQSVVVLPLLYEDCRIPESLRTKHFADFRTSFEQGLQSLIDSLQEHDKRKGIECSEPSSAVPPRLNNIKETLLNKLSGSESSYLVMDLGGTKAYISFITPEGERLYDIKFGTEGVQNQDELYGFIRKSIVQAIRGIHDITELPVEEIQRKIGAIGIAFPGPTDFARGMVLDAPNVKMKNYPLGEKLKEEFGLPAYIENDVNLGVLGEAWKGVARGYSSAVGIIIGTGVGGGIMIGGKIYRGKNHTAGEIGHLVVDYNSSIQCGCGQFGCLEALSSRRAMARQIEKTKKEKGDHNLLWKEINLGSNEIADHFRDGDEDTRKVVQRAGELCGKAVFSILNLLNPEIIFFGGGFVKQLGDEFLEPVREEAKKCMNAVYSFGENEIPIVLGVLDNPMLVGACKMINDMQRSTSLTIPVSVSGGVTEGLIEHDFEILRSLYTVKRPKRISKNPRSDFHEDKLRKLRNRGLIRTEGDQPFRMSKTVEITQIGIRIMEDNKS